MLWLVLVAVLVYTVIALGLMFRYFSLPDECTPVWVPYFCYPVTLLMVGVLLLMRGFRRD